MCGIAGFIDYHKKSTDAILKKQTDTLYHRGPDGEGQIVYRTELAHIGLGHRRLSIIDLSELGHQPMVFEHLSITFNGEIYNYQEIKEKLVKNGHQFKSHSDTEMILHAFQEWGINCIQEFVGMFAFILYDSQKQEIYAVRDRAGVKPLFYYWENDLFLFGSELKSLVAHPNFKKDLNTDVIPSFLQYSYIPTPHCIWKNTYKLKPGHYLKFDIKNKSYTTTQYWNVYDAYNKPILNIDFEEAKTETEKVLRKAFEYRMVADVPVGVFLSGGFDSSCVTALLQTQRTTKLKTYTIGVGDKTFNEAPFAKEIAKYLGTEHTEYYCTEKEALELIPDLPFYYDEPFGDYSAIPTTLVSKMARKEVTVALSADAGDELFAGYSKYDYAPQYLDKIQKTPSWLKRMIHIGLPLTKGLIKTHQYSKLRHLLKKDDVFQLMDLMTQSLNNEEIQKIIKTQFKKLPSYFDSREFRNISENISPMLAMDYQTYLLDDILQKVDRATMTASLEGREPFLDHHILEWVAQLPIEYKYNNGVKKYILKEIVYKHIPKKIMDRPKMGFAIPINKWLRTDLKNLFDIYFDKQFLIHQNIFNTDEILHIKNKFLQGDNNLTILVWNILMFQMWYKKWMN